MKIENNMEFFACPVCGSVIRETVFQCIDHSVTGEVFDIVQCKPCGYAQTFPLPNESEIDKYYETDYYVSHSETHNGIVNKLYLLIRWFNVRAKLNIVKRIACSRNNLLDVGCGTGFFLAYCKKHGWNITGVERNTIARKKTEERINASVYTSIYAVTGKKFDVITLWHVFEHLFNINKSFEQLKSMLTPHGFMIFALPNKCSMDAGIYGSNWAAFDVPRHLSHFSPVSVRLLAEKHGMVVKKIIPMKIDAYYVSMLSEQIRGKKEVLSLLRGIYMGLRSNISAKRTGDYSSLIYIIGQK
ncbi:MAG: class I SAM-dependent methyltransferase [Bacteroidales bacterium]|jgi:SAM-dependent methyltransferase|nr:class I SAM-dependent methyltransferase [Bacteroidales bacterium]